MNSLWKSSEKGRERVCGWLRRNGYGMATPYDERWFCNLFHAADVPYLWRSNERCSRTWFLKGLRRVLQRAQVPFPALMFHENLGGWRCPSSCPSSRFLELRTLDELIHFLDRHVWNLGRELSSFRRSDNYNILFNGGDICLVLSHENELLLYSRDVKLLELYRNLFDDVRLKIWQEGA